MPQVNEPTVIVRHTGPELQYTASDAEALAQFLDSDTGRKLLIAADDRIIELALNGQSRDFVLGAKHMINFISSLIPDLSGDEEEEMVAIQHNDFAGSGAMYQNDLDVASDETTGETE